MGNATSLEHLAQEFEGLFRSQVYRLESLDFYDAPNEREPLAAFRAGRPVDQAWRANWKRIAGAICDSGRQMARVHVVTEPLTDYLRFMMLHGYPANVGAGEDVRILARTAAQEARLPHLDYWLFDDDLAGVLVYDSAGTVGHVEWHSRRENPEFLAACCRWRQTALRLASPLAEYVVERDITSERTTA
jgi:uncharacterized protein DUF6879